MPIDYIVETGDCISSIAFDHGFFWETIWNHPKNAELKTKRKDPNILQEDDIVYTPDLTLKRVSRPTNQKHKFVRKGAPAKLRFRIMEEPKPEETQTAAGGASPGGGGGGGGSFLDKAADAAQKAIGLSSGGGATKEFSEPDPQPRTVEDKPRKNVPFVAIIDGKVITGNTDGDGRIELYIPPNASSGTLTLDPGTLKERVIPLNLGHLNPIKALSGVTQRLNNLGFPCGDGSDEVALTSALKAFQEKNGLSVTGNVDDATRNKLRDLHAS
jgi:hypothetical protein